MLNADEARKLTSVTIQDALIKMIEREIIDRAARGYKHFMSTIVLADSGLQFLRDNGYKAELCEDDTLKCLIGTIISWE
jgi:hypothetical protein